MSENRETRRRRTPIFPCMDIDDDACYRAMDWLTEITGDLERKVFDSLVTLLNLEVDVLFFDTTSTYFVTEDEDDPVTRDDRGMPLASAFAGLLTGEF